MPVELRKRKAPPPPPVRPAKKKATNPKADKPKKEEKSAVDKAKATVVKATEAVKEAVTGKANGAAKTSSAPKVGDTIDLAGFGGEVETHDGNKTTFAKLVEESKGGVVLFTYPKASTPGCTNQVCLFRDSYEPLTATGFGIYGLSNDSPKANTNFKTKQNLPYTLLCDPSQTLISAIGLKKAPKGTTRGVFVVDKAGKVLASEPGSPAGTVEVVKKLVSSSGADTAAAGVPGKEKEDAEAAKTAAEVADTAAKVDSNEA